MKKLLLYIGFITASLADAAIFLTSNDYIQLIVAILLYLPLAYVAFKLFPRKPKLAELNANTLPNNITTDTNKSVIERSDEIEVSDIDKRVFIKLIGATGITFFLSSLFSKKFGSLPGSFESSGTTSIQDPIGNVIDPAKHHPTDNYKISEVEYGIETFYGFMDENNRWYIMKEDLNSGTFRYAKGDIDFTTNWNNRKNLKYDYYNQVF